MLYDCGCDMTCGDVVLDIFVHDVVGLLVVCCCVLLMLIIIVNVCVMVVVLLYVMTCDICVNGICGCVMLCLWCCCVNVLCNIV